MEQFKICFDQTSAILEAAQTIQTPTRVQSGFLRTLENAANKAFGYSEATLNDSTNISDAPVSSRSVLEDLQPSRPITDICIVHANEETPEGFDKVTLTVSGRFTANILKATPGRAMNICTKRASGKKQYEWPVTNIVLVRPDLGEPIPPGFEPVLRSTTRSPANLFGDKNSNGVMYLCYTRAVGSPITGIGLLQASPGDTRDIRTARRLFSEMVGNSPTQDTSTNISPMSALVTQNAQRSSKRKWSGIRRGTPPISLTSNVERAVKDVAHDKSSPVTIADNAPAQSGSESNILHDVDPVHGRPLPARQSQTSLSELRKSRGRAKSMMLPNSKFISSQSHCTLTSPRSTYSTLRQRDAPKLAASGMAYLDIEKMDCVNDAYSEDLPEGWHALTCTATGHHSGFSNGTTGPRLHQYFYVCMRKDISHILHMMPHANNSVMRAIIATLKSRARTHNLLDCNSPNLDAHSSAIRPRARTNFDHLQDNLPDQLNSLQAQNCYEHSQHGNVSLPPVFEFLLPMNFEHSDTGCAKPLRDGVSTRCVAQSATDNCHKHHWYRCSQRSVVTTGNTQSATQTDDVHRPNSTVESSAFPSQVLQRTCSRLPIDSVQRYHPFRKSFSYSSLRQTKSKNDIINHSEIMVDEQLEGKSIGPDSVELLNIARPVEDTTTITSDNASVRGYTSHQQEGSKPSRHTCLTTQEWARSRTTGSPKTTKRVPMNHASDITADDVHSYKLPKPKIISQRSAFSFTNIDDEMDLPVHVQSTDNDFNWIDHGSYRPNNVRLQRFLLSSKDCTMRSPIPKVRSQDSVASHALAPLLLGMYSNAREVIQLSFASLTNVIEQGFFLSDAERNNAVCRPVIRGLMQAVLAVVSDVACAKLNDIHELVPAFCEAVLAFSNRFAEFCDDDDIEVNVSDGGFSPMTWQRLLWLQINTVLFLDLKRLSLYSASFTNANSSTPRRSVQLLHVSTRRNLAAALRATEKFAMKLGAFMQINLERWLTQAAKSTSENFLIAVAHAISNRWQAHDSATPLWALDVGFAISHLTADTGHYMDEFRGVCAELTKPQNLGQTTIFVPPHARDFRYNLLCDWFVIVAILSRTIAELPAWRSASADHDALCCKDSQQFPIACVLSPGPHVMSSKLIEHYSNAKRLISGTCCRTALKILKTFLSSAFGWSTSQYCSPIHTVQHSQPCTQLAESPIVSVSMKTLVFPALLVLASSASVADFHCYTGSMAMLRGLWATHHRVCADELRITLRVYLHSILHSNDLSLGAVVRKCQAIGLLFEWFQVPQDVWRFYVTLDLGASTSARTNVVQYDSTALSPECYSGGNPQNRLLLLLIASICSVVNYNMDTSEKVHTMNIADWSARLYRTLPSVMQNPDVKFSVDSNAYREGRPISTRHLEKEQVETIVSMRRTAMSFLRHLLRIIMDSAATIESNHVESQLMHSHGEYNNRANDTGKHKYTNVSSGSSLCTVSADDETFSISDADHQASIPCDDEKPRVHTRYENDLPLAKHPAGHRRTRSALPANGEGLAHSTRMSKQFTPISPQPEPSKSIRGSNMRGLLRGFLLRSPGNSERQSSFKNFLSSRRLFRTGRAEEQDTSASRSLNYTSTYSVSKDPRTLKSLPANVLRYHVAHAVCAVHGQAIAAACLQSSIRSTFRSLESVGLLHKEDPFMYLRLARRLAHVLGPEALGEFLGEGGRDASEEHFLKIFRRIWIWSLGFKNRIFVDALRALLTSSGFRLPGESQKIERITEAFAWVYFYQNNSSQFCQTLLNDTPDNSYEDNLVVSIPLSELLHESSHNSDSSEAVETSQPSDSDTQGHFWPSSVDVCHILSYSIIMLNTDLHNPSTKSIKRMSVQDFIRNNRGIDNGHDLSHEFLSSIYNDIACRPIELERPTNSLRDPEVTPHQSLSSNDKSYSGSADVFDGFDMHNETFNSLRIQPGSEPVRLSDDLTVRFNSSSVASDMFGRLFKDVKLFAENAYYDYMGNFLLSQRVMTQACCANNTENVFHNRRVDNNADIIDKQIHAMMDSRGSAEISSSRSVRAICHTVAKSVQAFDPVFKTRNCDQTSDALYSGQSAVGKRKTKNQKHDAKVSSKTVDSTFGMPLPETLVVMLLSDLWEPIIRTIRSVLSRGRALATKSADKGAKTDGESASQDENVQANAARVDLQCVESALDCLQYLLCSAILLRQSAMIDDALSVLHIAHALAFGPHSIETKGASYRRKNAQAPKHSASDHCNTSTNSATSSVRSRTSALSEAPLGQEAHLDRYSVLLHIVGDISQHFNESKFVDVDNRTTNDTVSHAIVATHQLVYGIRQQLIATWNTAHFRFASNQFDKLTRSELMSKPARRLLFVGPIIKACKSGKGRLKSYIMWLFSDLLVYGSRARFSFRGYRYNAHALIPLRGLTLIDDPPSLQARKIGASFALVGNNRYLCFFCENPDETIAWRRNLREAIRDSSWSETEFIVD